jgi:hypothetical protein
MPPRRLFAVTCLAVAAGTPTLLGQTPPPAATTMPAPTPAPAADCCPPPCPVKTLCDHFKGAPAHGCAAAPAPKITVVVPPPQVVFRPAGAPAPCAAGPLCAKRPAVPAAPLAAAPVAQQPYLVPQVSYTVQPVVTWQAVPTVSYGVVGGPAPPIAAPYMAAPAAPWLPCPTADVDTVVRLIKLLKELAGGGLGTAPDPANADAARLIKELDVAIKQTRQDLLELSTANHNNIAAVVEALKADTKIDQKTKDSLPKLVPVGPVKK